MFQCNVLARRIALLAVCFTLAGCVDDRFEDGQFLCHPKGGSDECPAEMVCGSDGRCARQPASGTGGDGGGDGCVPLTCDDLGKKCGAVSNGCGKLISCDCALPLTCGGTGIADECGCAHRKVFIKSPRALYDVVDAGTVAWVKDDILAASASDNAYVTTTAELGDGATSYLLKVVDFDFESAFELLPNDVVVTGIGLVIERSQASGAGELADAEVSVLLDGNPLPLDGKQSGNWPAQDGSTSYGGDGELWGATSIDIALVKQTNFGAGIAVSAGGGAATPRIDHVQLSVHYEDPACPLDGG